MYFLLPSGINLITKLLSRLLSLEDRGFQFIFRSKNYTGSIDHTQTELVLICESTHVGVCTYRHNENIQIELNDEPFQFLVLLSFYVLFPPWCSDFALFLRFPGYQGFLSFADSQKGLKEIQRTYASSPAFQSRMRGIRFPHVPIKESRAQHHAFSTPKVLQCHPCSSDLTLRVRAGVFCTFRSRIRATTAPRVGRTPGSPCFTPPDSHLPGLTTSLVGLPRSCMPGHAFFSASPQTMAALLMGTFEVFLKVHNCEPMAMNTDK